MKRLFTLLSAFLLLTALLPVSALAADSQLVVSLTHVPKYGDTSLFQGVVHARDGSAFHPSDYRISLYLQITENGTYWVKPTYAMPYAELGEDGSFAVRYVTGGVDEQARVIHIMLIPASHTPTSDFAETRSKAVFYVKVTRAPEETPVVDPEIPAPGTNQQNAMPSPLPVSEDKIAVDIGFYTDGSSPGDPLSADLIRQQLNAVSGFADTVRFYGTSGELEKAYEIAHSMGFRVVGNAWLSGDGAADRREMDALISHCNNGYVSLAVVGSEALLRGDLTAAELIEDMEYVRERLTDKSIPVTTADTVDVLLENARVRSACSILMPNIYPYWAGISIHEAMGYFRDSLESLKAVSGGKAIVVSESGWPTSGQSVGLADTGGEEAGQYYAALRQYSLQTGTQVLFFEGADEPWKTGSENEAGAHWGILDSGFAVKSCYADHIQPGFTDVSPVSSYAPSIRWAVRNGITQGTSAVTFSPNNTCTHNHILTFLWRASGSPQASGPSTNANSSTDFGKAALWARERGLITSDDTGGGGCTRAQAVMYLWKLAGSPSVGGNRFSDVPPGADYSAAVSWAVENGITNGTSETTFSPSKICTRGQIVTFLYRYYANP